MTDRHTGYVVTKVKPLSPEELDGAKEEALPDAVLESFNGRAVVLQEDVLARILGKLPDVTREQVFERGWHRQAGWTVEYDKPGYNESYPATFFTTTGRARG